MAECQTPKPRKDNSQSKMLQHKPEIDTAPFPISALINMEEFAPSQNKESFESRVVHESYRTFCLNLGGGKFGAAQA